MLRDPHLARRAAPPAPQAVCVAALVVDQTVDYAAHVVPAVEAYAARLANALVRQMRQQLRSELLIAVVRIIRQAPDLCREAFDARGIGIYRDIAPFGRRLEAADEGIGNDLEAAACDERTARQYGYRAPLAVGNAVFGRESIDHRYAVAGGCRERYAVDAALVQHDALGRDIACIYRPLDGDRIARMVGHAAECGKRIAYEGEARHREPCAQRHERTHRESSVCRRATLAHGDEVGIPGRYVVGIGHFEAHAAVGIGRKRRLPESVVAEVGTQRSALAPPFGHIGGRRR